MFYGAVRANPDTSNWNVTSVINIRSMFEGSAYTENPTIKIQGGIKMKLSNTFGATTNTNFPEVGEVL